jgi:hypothetical protein
MTATNHVLTGVLIGAVVVNPWFALPAAFISHFVLDSLPHYGDEDHLGRDFKFVLTTDAIFAIFVLLAIAILQPVHWPILLLCGVVAESPDLMWLPLYIRDLRHLPKKPLNAFDRFHTKIQWGERPWGFLVEIVWFGAVLSLVLGRFS